MVKPFCALVGVKGSAFSVKIDDSESVADLKDAIKAQNEDITCDADELELFLARTESGAWLESRTNDVEKLKQGELTTAIEELTKENKQLQGEAGLQAVLEGMPSPTTNQIHVLVVIPNEGLESRTVDENTPQMFERYAEETRELHRKIVCKLDSLKRRLNPPQPTKSDSEMGHKRLNQLRKIGCVSSAEEKVGEDAFWSDETQADANNCRTENDLIAFITPYFSEALNSHDIVFVTSEQNKWSPQLTCGNINSTLKPSGFVTHCGMYHVEREPDNDVSQVDSPFRCGKAVKALYDCLVLFESKISISVYGAVVRIITAEWTMQGSKGLFRDFIMENSLPWVERLTAACSALNVEVVEGDSFLGDGAFGRVFKVKRDGQDGDVLALKIVDENSVDRLFREVSALKRAESTGLAIKPVGQFPRFLMACWAPQLCCLLWGNLYLIQPQGKRREPFLTCFGSSTLLACATEILACRM
ncbi:hypothetical protein PsorP6_013532 [Peronosclerospora sorghi]|uniref:Uncharacterized protein n=1 Tax=Peronosclerospora sorghi TaxID=230839 RepID=A0ACC0VJ13_9STRA|nr:hypothetical protein PsorP6_013532 [Peronosclerospora sorghi]